MAPWSPDGSQHANATFATVPAVLVRGVERTVPRPRMTRCAMGAAGKKSVSQNGEHKKPSSVVSSMTGAAPKNKS